MGARCDFITQSPHTVIVMSSGGRVIRVLGLSPPKTAERTPWKTPLRSEAAIDIFTYRICL
jgi:hypothetical protein